MKIEYKTFPLEVKGAEDSGRIEGYASTFGNVDFGGDMVMPGAFEKTIREQRGVFPILADHMPSWQIGWNEKASEDSRGLAVSGALDVAVNQKAKEKHSLAKKGMQLGASVGLSIGYSTMKWEMTTIDGKSVRLLKEVRLWEYSLVTFPMNDEAMLTGAKSWLEGPAFDSSLEELIAAFSAKGYSQRAITEALAKRAADSRREPELDLHSVMRQIESLDNLLTAG